MHDLFALLVLGHLTGDYLLQNRWMAMNKSGSSFKCAVHSVLYTAAVVSITWPMLNGWMWTVAVFLSHFPIDRWSLADHWLSLIGGRTMRGFLAKGEEGIPEGAQAGNYWVLRGGFTAVVYAVADNTMHLLLMWYAAALLI